MDNSNIEYKVKSIRADDETYEKFKAIATEQFGNQGQCLSTLINLYELEQSKMTIVERKLEIDSFQLHLNKISEQFMMSLKLNQDAEVRIRAEFERLLESKDRLIMDLQTKVEQFTKATEVATETIKELKSENTTLFSDNLKLRKQIEKDKEEHAHMMMDKDNLNKALTDSCNERKIEIEKLQKEVELHKTEAEEFIILKRTVSDLDSNNKEITRELETLKTEHAKELVHLKETNELDKDRALLSLEKTLQKEIKDLNKQHNIEIKEYIAKIENFGQAQEELIKKDIENIK